MIEVIGFAFGVAVVAFIAAGVQYSLGVPFGRWIPTNKGPWPRA